MYLRFLVCFWQFTSEYHKCETSQWLRLCYTLAKLHSHKLLKYYMHLAFSWLWKRWFLFSLNWHLFNSIVHLFQSLQKISKPQGTSEEYNHNSNNLPNIGNLLGGFWSLFTVTLCMIFYGPRSEENGHLHIQKTGVALTNNCHNGASFQLSNQNKYYFFCS